MTWAVDMSGPLWGRAVCYNVEERAKREAERKAEREKLERFDPNEFTYIELVALMSSGHNNRHQAIFFGLREKTGRIPFDVLASLRERGLIEQRSGRGLHVLTNAGSAIADKVADHLVQLHDLHFGFGVHAKTGRYSGITRCVCGWHASVSSFNFQENANRAFSGHLRQVEAAKAMAG